MMERVEDWMAIMQQSCYISHIATDSPPRPPFPNRRSNIWASQTTRRLVNLQCTVHSNKNLEQIMAYMGQRPECGYEKMGADSYKSQNWLGQVNMTIVHECFCENLQICKFAKVLS